MLHELRYGTNATLRLNLPDEIQVTDCSVPRGEPLSDPQAAVTAALAEPLSFPPLALATVAGDKVVLALDCDVPQAALVVAGIVQALLSGATTAADITVLQTPTESEEAREHVLARLPDDVRRTVRVVTHDAADMNTLAYLAASKHADPIYVNRVLSDADVVVPISAVRLESSLTYFGPHSSLFPTFSDEATQKRFRVADSDDRPAHLRRRRKEVDEAAWLLGVQFSVQVVPGPGDSILHVVAGETRAASLRARELAESAWLHTVPYRASLVVASIEGGPDQQTWETFARALFAASSAVTEDGTIVLCTNLRRKPGPALRRLANWTPGENLPTKIRRDRAPDPLSATLLAEVRQHSRVYLLSGLGEETVEALGIACVTEPTQIDRLTRQHDSCLLLGNAQHAVVAMAE